VFLKRIILHGFKSFADRTEFEFGPGVTSIVGPNGCGKSNVLDALRWVLGTQSARSLRGKTMSDVIFSGSRSRKPANAAHVELTFDNRSGFLASDEEEVTVTRVLHRSGESEYRLNGNACRLKDIRHLLLDTGLGVDAYSIIEQGRVDMLLQADPVQRREIFEEAAGISRYKVQRAEAQRKLERTQNNLLRLNDVVEELERQLRSVKLAAGKARRWQEYDGRLRALRASFSLAEYHELECGRRTARAQVAALQDQVAQQRAALASHDAAAAEQQRVLQQLDEEIQAADARLAALRSEHSALSERITQSERRAADLAATRDRRRTQVDELAGRLNELEQRAGLEQAALETLAAEAEQAGAAAAQLQSTYEATVARRNAAREMLEHAKTAAFEVVRSAALLRSEQNNLGAQRDRLLGQRQRLAERRAALDEELAELERQRDAAEQRVAALEQRSTELAAGLRAAEAEGSELQAGCAEQEAQIAVAKEQRSAACSRLELLEDMERRLEGVDQGTQTLLSWRADEGSDGSVLGLVADLLRITDSRAKALEPLLATFENHLVVANTYALLSELGRRPEPPGPVRVLALDRIPAQGTRVDYEGAPGVVARAVDWVACAPTYRALAEHLLGRVIIVDELERGLALAAGAPAGFSFVTLDGQIVTAEGRLTLAGAKASSGLMSRKAEIRQLRQQLDEIETGLERAIRQKNELEARRADVQLRHSELMNQIAVVQQERAEARGVLTRVAGELARGQREASVADSELDALQRALAELEQQAVKLAAELASVGQAQQAQETEVGDAERELLKLEAAVGALAGELTEAKVAAGRLFEKRRAGEEALARLAAQRSAVERERSAARQEAEAAARHMAEAEQERSAAEARRAACAAELQQEEAGVMQLRAQRQARRGELEEFGVAARAVSERIRELEADLHQQEVALRELDVRQEGLVERIRSDLDLDLAACYEQYEHAEQDWEAIRAEIAELREKLARLGHVNLEALTELEELTPRYENLVAQRDDLVGSIERLEALIRELDAESRSRFAVVFEQIRVNFQELFRQLFGGGKADILLEDPEEPLECGIEIVARPPGKEPQSLSLLSGGEKTMTAVALVMAVFKSKPSPFAFLDEVDAALDEANTERFNTMLQGFLSQSQFVVITHSKRTMQSADVLYGVTMEEPGVSKRVSVRFNDERVKAPSVA
jgi:chromosome segregation protein